jgi:hypothetical protein
MICLRWCLYVLDCSLKVLEEARVSDFCRPLDVHNSIKEIINQVSFCYHHSQTVLLY